ncbi:serine hydroxymethyltransferase, partial [Acinetobacter lactucae]|uniref:serine hydroxymethyltransferase n=1 Tax=Acinetobacter lactucae TaxID=1785128 RepID=UPI001580AF0B
LMQEKERRNNSLTLIASEWAMANHIKDALSSVFAEKYFEGTPSNSSLERLQDLSIIDRELVKLKKPGWYAPGCEIYDDLSWLSQSLVLDLFDPNNVTNYYVDNRILSGSQANLAVVLTIMKKRKKNRLKILCLDMNHGGHLSHGLKSNILGIIHDIFEYQFSETSGLMDYDNFKVKVNSINPDLVIYGGSACPRDWDHSRIKQIVQGNSEAELLFDGSHPAGLIATGLNNNPFFEGIPFITMTTNKTLCGPRGAFIACLPEYAESLARSVFPGLTAGPHGHEIFAKLVTYEYALTEQFKTLMQNVKSNAAFLSMELTNKYNIKLVSGGTDTHMILIDLNKTIPNRNLTGLQIEIWAENCGFYMNRNTIPFDPKPAQNETSGIRVGVGVATQRGMGHEAMSIIAKQIAHLIYEGEDPYIRSVVKQNISKLVADYPFSDTYL